MATVWQLSFTPRKGFSEILFSLWLSYTYGANTARNYNLNELQ